MIPKKLVTLVAAAALLAGFFNFAPAGASGTIAGTCPGPQGAPVEITFTFKNNVFNPNLAPQTLSQRQIMVATGWSIDETEPTPTPEGVCFRTNPFADTLHPYVLSDIYLEGSSGVASDDINCDSVDLSGTGILRVEGDGLGSIPVSIHYSGSFSSGVLTLVGGGGGERSTFAAAGYFSSPSGYADCIDGGAYLLTITGRLSFAQYP